VRLKERNRKESARYSNISIPFGAIKREPQQRE